MTTMYDPEGHLERAHPEVTLHVGRIRPAHAAWFPTRKLILVDSALDPATRRCCLAHELEHIHEGSTHAVDVLGARQELRVDRAAARQLISLDELVNAVFLHGDADGIARELDVTSHMVCVRVENLTDAERAYVDERLWAREESA